MNNKKIMFLMELVMKEKKTSKIVKQFGINETIVTHIFI